MALLLKLLLAGLAGGVVLLGLALWFSSKGLTNPRGYAQPDPATFRFEQTPKTAAGVGFQDFEAATPGGEKVRGWLVPAQAEDKRLGVVFLHGRAGDRRQGLPFLPMLHQMGAGVALIDLRENGLSDGAGRGTGLAMREAQDAVAAAAQMRRQGYGKVVVLGCSLGGAAAILAAAQDPTIDGAAADSPVPDFAVYEADVAGMRLSKLGLPAPKWLTAPWGEAVIALTKLRIGLSGLQSPAEAIGTIAPRPVLIVQGEADPVVLPVHAAPLAARGGPSTSLLMLPKAGHCDGVETAPEAYRAGVAAFLAKVAAPGA